jgi:hypothetical protein
MSRQNKANKNNYTQAGRLTPDDMARERHVQTRERVTSPRADRPAKARAAAGSSSRRNSRAERA